MSEPRCGKCGKLLRRVTDADGECVCPLEREADLIRRIKAYVDAKTKYHYLAGHHVYAEQAALVEDARVALEVAEKEILG